MLILFTDETLAANADWRALTVEFYKYLSAGSSTDSARFPIDPNPIRLMPGGLERVVPDAFQLIGSGKVADREKARVETDVEAKPWLKPISGEKLVYKIVD